MLNTFHFSLPVGHTQEQAVEVLNAIKRSMSDVLHQASAVDMSANDETIFYAKKIYRQVKEQLRLMQENEKLICSRVRYFED